MALLEPEAAGARRSTRSTSAGERRRCCRRGGDRAAARGRCAGVSTIDADAEVTLEANPEDVSAEPGRLARAPASTGCRSASSRSRTASCPRSVAGTMRRARAAALADARAARGCRSRATSSSGLPGQTRRELLGERRGSATPGVEHVSIYLLETEKSKTIEEDRRLHPERYLSDDAQADMWLEMGEALAGRGLRALRDLELGAGRPGGAAQPEVLDARADARPRRVLPRALGRAQAGERLEPRAVPRRALAEAAGRWPSTSRSVPAEAAREEIFLGPASFAGVPAERGAPPIVASEDAASGTTTRAGCRSGILERTGRPRAVHRAGLSRLERGAQPVRLKRSRRPKRSGPA